MTRKITVLLALLLLLSLFGCSHSNGFVGRPLLHISGQWSSVASDSGEEASFGSVLFLSEDHSMSEYHGYIVRDKKNGNMHLSWGDGIIVTYGHWSCEGDNLGLVHRIILEDKVGPPKESESRNGVIEQKGIMVEKGISIDNRIFSYANVLNNADFRKMHDESREAYRRKYGQ